MILPVAPSFFVSDSHYIEKSQNRNRQPERLSKEKEDHPTRERTSIKQLYEESKNFQENKRPEESEMLNMR